ncbi:MAG: protein-disulfide isomerase [Actinomycetota bacterium]|nr:protein-disulfide isomerase [Actinomycetota bacterium]
MIAEAAALTPNMARPFTVNFDYRCPYARIAHDHVVRGLRAGADWDVTFVPFSLGQAHVEEGESDIWSRPADDSGLLALQLGIAVRDTQPQHFLDVHAGLFALRHDSGGDLRDRARLDEVLAATDVDVDAAWAEVDGGRALATIEKEHVASVEGLQVWGVPTFSTEGRAAFVRLLDRPADDAEAVASVERVVDTLGWELLNEFKHTSIPR